MGQGVAGSFHLSSYHDPLNSDSDNVCSLIKVVGNVYTRISPMFFKRPSEKNYIHSAHVPLISNSEVAMVSSVIWKMLVLIFCV